MTMTTNVVTVIYTILTFYKLHFQPINELATLVTLVQSQIQVNLAATFKQSLKPLCVSDPKNRWNCSDCLELNFTRAAGCAILPKVALEQPRTS